MILLDIIVENLPTGFSPSLSCIVCFKIRLYFNKYDHIFMVFSSIVTPVMTYGPLDSMVNNWHYQLQEQEKHYFYQAHQFNVWNHALIETSNEVRRYSH